MQRAVLRNKTKKSLRLQECLLMFRHNFISTATTPILPHLTPKLPCLIPGFLTWRTPNCFASRLFGNLLSAWGNGHSILRLKDPILTESQSSLGVPRACRATPSLLLLVLADEVCENLPLWQTSNLSKCPITAPFTKNRWSVPGVSCSTGSGSWIGKCPWKKKSNNVHLLVFKFEDLSQLLTDLRLQDPTLKIKVTE